MILEGRIVFVFRAERLIDGRFGNSLRTACVVEIHDLIKLPESVQRTRKKGA